MRFFAWLIPAFISAFSCTAYAGISGFAGYADGANDGLELALGYKYESRIGASIFLYPIQGVVYSTAAPSGYREETFSNGNTVCRDLSNGQFAEKENCAPGSGFEYSPSVELMQRVYKYTSIGAGYRWGGEPSPYGVFKINIAEKAHVGFRGGSNYIGGFIGFAL